MIRASMMVRRFVRQREDYSPALTCSRRSCAPRLYATWGVYASIFPDLLSSDRVDFDNSPPADKETRVAIFGRRFVILND